MKTIIEAVVTSLPLPLILQMEMRQRQRYMVSGLFALGYVVTGAGIARTYFTYKAFFDSGYDIAWWQMPVFMSSTIENNLAIVSSGCNSWCCCVAYEDFRSAHAHRQSDRSSPSFLVVHYTKSRDGSLRILQHRRIPRTCPPTRSGHPTCPRWAHECERENASETGTSKVSATVTWSL